MTRQEMIRGLNRILAEYEYELDQIDREVLNMAIEALEQEPICCKDCKNWHSTGGTDKERKGWCSVWKSWNYSKPDDYCSFAEQKESDIE